jgi:hypothetical protein
MFFIPGFLIAIVTFPGIVAHEVGHRFFCDLAGVPVYEVCYFRAGNPSGYVVHAPAASLGASFLITIGPLIVNTVLCAVISFTPIISLNLDVADPPGVFFLLLWLGISIGMHALPERPGRREFLRRGARQRAARAAVRGRQGVPTPGASGQCAARRVVRSHLCDRHRLTGSRPDRARGNSLDAPGIWNLELR